MPQSRFITALCKKNAGTILFLNDFPDNSVMHSGRNDCMQNVLLYICIYVVFVFCFFYYYNYCCRGPQGRIAVLANCATLYKHCINK